MNIQFFGHSIFSSGYLYGRNNNEPATLVEIINEKYNIEGKYITVPTISQERILMEVKKYKQHMDFAVIAHANPMNVYYPSLDHDFQHASIPSENIRYWSTDTENDRKFLFTRGKFFTERTMDRTQFEQLHWSTINEQLIIYKEFHYNPDLQKNRAYGALIQVVDYLKAKNIKAIHLTRKDLIPSWFEFTHGIVDSEILYYQYNPPYATTYNKSLNAISAEGNVVAAKKLIEYIENYEKYAIEYKNGKT